MRVALDGAPLGLVAGGLRRYVEELTTALRAEFPADQFEPLTPSGGRWWLNGVWKHPFDVFHGTNFEVPVLPLRPAVVTVHDLAPWRYPANNPRVRQRTPWLLRLRLARFVITPSEAVRREVIGEFGLPADRVVATPLAAPEWMRPPREAPDVGPPFFLYVGDDIPRKNVQLIRDAAAALGVELRETRGRVPDRELPALYAAAAAVLYPSHYEGFGLPVLEAMQCGGAVITSRDPALMETGGEATLAVEPDGWVEAMRALLEQPERRRTLQKKALDRAQTFSWARTARATYDIYIAALR
ncbi:MAG: glycosyltransferase family 1 protein [Acidobacteria bacterium]|nr:glycosyltransferase family 1 protein [Acidobacteriota bacterium]